MKLFLYRQNNSGGLFDEELGYYVYIEALTSAEANTIAESVGIYFNGCDKGRDCDCCGDRWMGKWDEDDDTPTVEDLLSDREYATSWGLDILIKKHGQPLRPMSVEDCSDYTKEVK